MKTREELIQEKSDAIIELEQVQIECVKQTLKIMNKATSVYPRVNMRRAWKIFACIMKAKQIQFQIDMIKAQPIFPSGGLPIVGEEIKIKQTP